MKPTSTQLEKINKFSHTPLSEDQVYVFRSLSADTLPVQRYGWYGEYAIRMTSSMLNALKKSYQVGVGLLASHDNSRLPFGRTFDAEVLVDEVDNESVQTMYVDHYIVTHTKDSEGNNVPLRTEINGMTTQDIVNHIDVGHTFDTSIGFSITKPTCSICKHDIRDYQECSHIPGKYYDVQVGDNTEQFRCDILAEDGEGLENSLVYAGAVNRAIITNGKTASNENYSAGLQGSVNNSEPTLYNVEDIKTVPVHSELLCRMSKGNMELFTVTPERNDRNDLEKMRGSEQMAENTKTVTAEPIQQGLALAQTADMVSLEEYNKVVGEKENFANKVEQFELQVSELTEKLGVANEKVVELTAKSELADKFTKDLIEDTVKAGVQARGNKFSAERYRKYAETLSVDELREELQAFKAEFPGAVEDARVTSQELNPERTDTTVEMSQQEVRELAARNAMQRYRTSGGNLEELTREELAKLSK